MSEPTYRGDAPARGDWSQVYTNLDWVTRWMTDHGYTDAEVSYVVGQAAFPAAPADVTLARVEARVEVPVEEPPVVEVGETGEPVWTIQLTVVEPDSATAKDAPVSGPADAGDQEPTEAVSV